MLSTYFVPYGLESLHSPDPEGPSPKATLGHHLLQHEQPLEMHPMAFALLREAAEAGDLTAEYNLGVCYLKGYGVGKSVPDALMHIRYTANHGHKRAMYTLAALYYNGDLIPKNWVEAAKWAKAAAEAFEGYDSDAEYFWGRCLLLGHGVDPDPEEAAKWLNSASEGEHWGAVYLLAVCHYKGLGVPKSLDQAYDLCDLAARNQDADALRLLPELRDLIGLDEDEDG